jgi:hypothetical protein
VIPGSGKIMDKTAIRIPGKRSRSTTKKDVDARKALVRSYKPLFPVNVH